MRFRLLIGLAVGGGCMMSGTPTSGTSPMGCATHESPIVVGGVLDADVAWLCTHQPYVITSDVHVVAGATLTIGSNVEVRGLAGTSILVGERSPGALIADGSRGPILFTSAEPHAQPGDWVGIVVGEQATRAVFDHVTVEYAGASRPDAPLSGEAGVHVVGEADITASTFQRNRAAGIRLAEAAVAGAFGTNTFRGNVGHAVVVSAAGLASIASANTVEGDERVYVTGGEVTETGHWGAFGAPYRFGADVRINGAVVPAVVTVGPGAELEFETGVSMVVGSIGGAGLVVQGNASNPVLFTSASGKAPGGWGGVVLDRHATEASFDHAAFRFGGARNKAGSFGVEAMLAVLGGEVSIANSSFYDSLSSGVLFAVGGRARAFHDNDFDGNRGPAVSVDAPAAASLGTPNRFGAGQLVRITGGVVDESGTWSNLGVPYHVTGDIYIEGFDSTPLITIAPGTEFRMDAGRGVTVGSGGPGGLVADAAGADPIVFTSSAPSPAAGDWEGVVVDTYSSTGTFRNAVFQFGGAPAQDASVDTAAALTAFRSSITVTDCVFGNNQTAGLHVFPDADVLAFRRNTFGGGSVKVPAGVVGSLDGPNTFESGTYVEVTGGTVDVSGLWSDLGAPYHLLDTVHVEGVGAPVVTLAPAVELRMGADVSVVVGRRWPGGFVANGNAARIRLTSAASSPAAGDWSALVFESNSTVGTLSGVDFAYCGGSTLDTSVAVSGCVGVIEASPSIVGCHFDASSSNGIDLLGAAAPVLKGNVFTNIVGNDVD